MVSLRLEAFIHIGLKTFPTCALHQVFSHILHLDLTRQASQVTSINRHQEAAG